MNKFQTLFILCEIIACIIGILIGVLITTIYYLRIIKKFRKYLEEVLREIEKMNKIANIKKNFND
jgi:hypothetical protein